MSRVGLKPIDLPSEVKIKIEKKLVEVTGPLGTLRLEIKPGIQVKQENNQLLIERKSDSRREKSLHGLVRTLIDNMILGVTKGWHKTLEIHGTGYRVAFEGNDLILSLGFSHPVKVEAIKGIKFELKGDREILISGIDKVLVGNVAAKIRKIKPPDAYKGKGIRYQSERVKLKPGKAGKAGAAGGTV